MRGKGMDFSEISRTPRLWVGLQKVYKIKIMKHLDIAPQKHRDGGLLFRNRRQAGLSGWLDRIF